MKMEKPQFPVINPNPSFMNVVSNLSFGDYCNFFGAVYATGFNFFGIAIGWYPEAPMTAFVLAGAGGGLLALTLAFAESYKASSLRLRGLRFNRRDLIRHKKPHHFRVVDPSRAEVVHNFSISDFMSYRTIIFGILLYYIYLIGVRVKLQAENPWMHSIPLTWIAMLVICVAVVALRLVLDYACEESADRLRRLVPYEEEKKVNPDLGSDAVSVAAMKESVTAGKAEEVAGKNT